MPSRRDGVGANRDGGTVRGGGYRDPYELEEDDADDENSNPATTSGKAAGVTVGKRRGVLGGSEAKKQSNIASLFCRQDKKIQAARLTPAGMVNLGNTCYLNSVVQVLLNMTSFTGDLRDPALEGLNQHLPAAGVWAALRTTADKLRTATLARPAFDCLKPAVEPSELRAAMGRRGSRWRSFAQQDAHEFLVELLEGLQSEVLAAEATASGRCRMPLSETRCPTARNLGGCLMHTWTCSACGRCTRLKEPFSCLSLQLPAHGSVNLQDLVSEYLKDETIDKNCEGCSPSAPVPHTAQHHFWRLPRVLVVHIKRFMPLPQPQQAPQQPSPPQRQGTKGGEAAAPAASPAVLAPDEPEAAAQASALSVPGMPRLDGTAAAGGPAAVADGAASVPTAPQPAAAGSRDPTPPAPYLYAKVHTVVRVTLGVDLARHCDAAARAHVHLLEALPPESLTRKVGYGDDSAAGPGSPAAKTGGHAGTDAGGGAGGGGATPAARLPGVPTACGTLDTAGGGSTCPSPSFMQPNSMLQERTVQQNGAAQPKDIRQRAILGASKAVTPGGARLPAPASECGTSAVSTGAQAEAGDGAPTPHGGVVGSAARPGSLRRQSEQERRRSPLGMGGGTGGPSAASEGAVGAGKSCGQAAKPHPGLGSTPQAANKQLAAGNGTGHATPTAVSMGGGMSCHTGNDGWGPSAQPPGNAARGGGGAGGVNSSARGCSGDAVACSERKAPRPMGASAFFGAAAATEPRGGGAGGGSCPPGRANGGGGGYQGNEHAPLRPLKRICVDATAAPMVKRASEPPCPVTATVTARRVEDMSEDEQLQYALRMSLAEEDGAATAGAAAGSGAVGAVPTGSVLDMSVPTAAGPAAATAAARSGAGGGDACVSRDSAGGGTAAFGAPRASQSGEDAGCDDGDSVVELQDESQGGTGREGRGGGGRGSHDGLRLASPSGASGDNNDGDESDCSGRGGALLDRRKAARGDRRRKRRVGNLFHHKVILDVAESPAVPPLPHQQQRWRTGSGYGGDDGVPRPVAYSVDDEDDGTTALSPVSGGGRRNAGAGDGKNGDSGAGEETTAADVEMAPADEDQDPEMAEAMRLSMETFQAEQKERKLRSSAGGAVSFESPRRSGGWPGAAAGSAPMPKGELEWERVLAIPDGAAGAAAATVEAVAAEPSCTTPRRGITPIAEGALRQLRRRASADSAGGGRLRSLDDAHDEGGGRVGGMDALVAAVGLETDGHSYDGAAGAGDTGKRPHSTSLRCSSGGNLGDGRAGGADQGLAKPFKFGFHLPEASAGAGAGAGAGTSAAPAGGLEFGGAGSRREEALDLTGGDDEDADLHKAIMLSLREANGDTVMMDAAADAAPLVMDLAGARADVDDAIEVEPAPAKPKVLLVPDSDYEEDSSDEEGRCNNGSGGGDGAAAAVAEPSAAAAATDGAAPSHGSQRQRSRKEAANGGAIASVPLAQLAKYRLQGVVRHKGLTPFSGHYVADVLVPNPSGSGGHVWYEHNDAVVSHVNFDRVQEDAAKQGYLFFFANAPRQGASLAAAVADAAAKPQPDF